MTHCAGVAWHKGHTVGKKQAKIDVERGVLRWRTFGRRFPVDPKSSKYLENQGTRWPLRRKIEREADELVRKAFGLQFWKRAAGSSVGLRRMKNWTLWRGWLPPKRKKRLHTE
jgi:hypothetical protein